MGSLDAHAVQGFSRYNPGTPPRIADHGGAYYDFPQHHEIPSYNPFVNEVSWDHQPQGFFPQHFDHPPPAFDHGCHIPCRVCTPPAPAAHHCNFGHHCQAHYPEYQQHHRRDIAAFSDESSGHIVNRRSQRLLWLSEEEAEIIRLIRLSQMKEGYPGSYSSSDPLFSVRTPLTTGGSRETRKVSSDTPSKCSHTSAVSVDELTLPASACSLEQSRADSGKLIDYQEVRRQEIKDIAANRQLAALRIQRSWRALSRRSTSSVQQLPDRRRATSMNAGAAKIIQRVWRAWITKKKERPSVANKLPQTMKEFYGAVKVRLLAKGQSPPTYSKFLKLVERVQAATEGARVRRRLKSRRLKAVIKEIKEIRAVLEEMSTDTPEASEHFLSQLSAQLRRKLGQLHTALQGPEDAARYLLRRSPATPLIIYGSRSASPSAHKQAQVRVLRNSQSEKGVVALRCSLFTVSNSIGPRRSPQAEGSSSKVTPRTNDIDVAKTSEDIQVSILGERASTESHHSAANRNAVSQRSSSTVQSATEPVGNHDHASQSRAESKAETPLTSSADDIEQLEPNKPKRPFLRRKSVSIPPQKLDWSKVKPMVSSRLEPELKVKLHKNKIKAIRTTSQQKMSYSKVKSRLFNYQVSSALETSHDVGEGQGYGEIHTQVGMNFHKEQLPATANGVPQVLQNFRYHEAYSYSEAEPSNSLASSPMSMNSPGKARNGFSDSQSQTVSEDDHDHSKEHQRGGSNGDVAPVPGASAGTRTVKVEQKVREQVVSASPELEAAFKHVMSLKRDSNISLRDLFRPGQAASIIPRLNPDSNIFRATFPEKRSLHEALIRDGCASKLRQDALAFVSTRD